VTIKTIDIHKKAAKVILLSIKYFKIKKYYYKKWLEIEDNLESDFVNHLKTKKMIKVPFNYLKRKIRTIF
jgi:hypothetical protein